MANCPHSQSTGSSQIKVAIVLNLISALLQAIVGIASGSLALLSDAAHNFSDVASLIISHLAQRIAKRSYTPQQTFGFKRAEILAAFINSASLIAVAIFICHSAIRRWWEPVEIHSSWVIAFAALGVLVNGLCAVLIKPHSTHSFNMRSAYLHLLSDMVTSIAVLLGGICMYFYGWTWIDGILSIAISLYLVYTASELLRQTIRVLMQFSPADFSLEELEKTISKFPQIANIHHVHCWQLNEKEIHLEAHLDFREDIPLSEVCAAIEEINKVLEFRHKITHTTLQAEIGTDDTKELLSCS
jgi:cobalt-zinc-cadmium efflux system protein